VKLPSRKEQDFLCFSLSTTSSASPYSSDRLPEFRFNILYSVQCESRPSVARINWCWSEKKNLMHFTLAQKGRPLWVTTNWRYNHPSIPVFPPLFLRPTYHLICIRSYTICQSIFEIISSTSRHSCVLALLWSYHFSEQWRNSTPQTRTMKTQGFGPSRTYRRKKETTTPLMSAALCSMQSGFYSDLYLYPFLSLSFASQWHCCLLP
jgi:hypothetical protein